MFCRFHLATEFKAIGIASLIMLIVWYLFNNIPALVEIDVYVFRFSVAVLFMAHVVAFTYGIVRLFTLNNSQPAEGKHTRINSSDNDKYSLKLFDAHNP